VHDIPVQRLFKKRGYDHTTGETGGQPGQKCEKTHHKKLKLRARLAKLVAGFYGNPRQQDS
jgi:hypothetical protein